MRSFDKIYAVAAKRKGGPAELEKLLDTPKSKAALKKIPDNRWLAEMTKRIFQAGFNWKVVEAKWDGFEEAFQGFDVARCAMLSDEDLGRLASDTRIIRNGAKIAAVRDNAVFLKEIAAEHGSAGAFFAGWPDKDYVGLLELLKKRGSRLGGATAQYFLRFCGKDSFITGGDVVTALIREGVVDKAPTSKRDLAAAQAAFTAWSEESGRPMMQISRTLACSVD